MILELCAAIGALWLRAQAPLERPDIPTTRVTVDLDGDGVEETAVVSARGGKARLEIRDARGHRLARVEASAPGSDAAVALRAGSLGSAGSLLEVFAARGQSECRTVWRFRGGILAPIPIQGRGGSLAECGAREWSYRWDHSSESTPARYVRERSRQTADGTHHQTEVFAFTGFRLELDPRLSSAEIGGVAIPLWSDAALYPKPALVGLYSRFDLSALKSAPRLRILADRAEGVFALRFEGSSGGDRRLAVRAATRGKEENEVILRAESGSHEARVAVRLSGDGAIPLEAAVQGLDPALDSLYAPVLRFRDRAIQIFPSAADELAVEELVGTWTTQDGRSMAISLVSAFPALLRFGTSEVSVSIDRAPPQIDALLVPRDGSSPAIGIVLRGPDRVARLPVRCEAAEGGWVNCRRDGPAEPLHRVGARVNLR